MIIGIVAIAENLAIGRAGKLPWHYSADLRFFKKTTTGNIVVMGANTWRSIGKPLPDRLNVVLSRSDELVVPTEVIKGSRTDDVLDLAKVATKDVFIIGGAHTYAAFADAIHKWIVTEIPETVADADTFMPADFLDDFEIEETIDLGDGLRVNVLHRR
jgi:dihydrofolate reductase